MIPSNVKQYRERQAEFHAWLLENGSAILATTNPFEIDRFLTEKGNTGIIYSNKEGKITNWQNGALAAYNAFDNKWRWRAAKRGDKIATKRINMIHTLASRDGWNSMYCGVTLNIQTATIEHVVSVTHGGTAHPANLTLACEPCNKIAAHASARQKFEIALKSRSKQ